MAKSNETFFSMPIPKAVAKFAIPTILSQMIVLIYNLADTFCVGHTGDKNQIAALTISFPIFMLMTAIGNLFGIGANSYMSRKMGEKNRKEAKKASVFALYSAIAGLIVLIIILLIGMEPILETIGTSSASYDYTRRYLMWTVVIGGVPTVVSLLLGHLLRAVGDTATASFGMILGGVLNMILDAVFIFVFGMDIGGAGMATAISNFISCIFFMYILYKRNYSDLIETNLIHIQFDKKMITSVILVGLPASSVIILGSAGNMIMTRLMSHYSDTAVAAFGVSQKIATVGIQITVGLTQGIMPLLGYNYGSRNFDRVKKINLFSFKLLAIYTVICLLIIELFAAPVTAFMVKNKATIELGEKFLRRWILCMPGMCFVNMFSSVFQAIGKWKVALILTFLRQGFIYIPVLFISDNMLGKFGLICAAPLSDTIAMASGIVMYLYTIRKIDKL